MTTRQCFHVSGCSSSPFGGNKKGQVAPATMYTVSTGRVSATKRQWNPNKSSVDTRNKRWGVCVGGVGLRAD